MWRCSTTTRPAYPSPWRARRPALGVCGITLVPVTPNAGLSAALPGHADRAVAVVVAPEVGLRLEYQHVERTVDGETLGVVVRPLQHLAEQRDERRLLTGR